MCGLAQGFVQQRPAPTDRAGRLFTLLHAGIGGIEAAHRPPPEGACSGMAYLSCDRVAGCDRGEPSVRWLPCTGAGCLAWIRSRVMVSGAKGPNKNEV